MPVSIVDTIPQVDSAETDQNSEPSIAVNPTNWQLKSWSALSEPGPLFRIPGRRQHLVSVRPPQHQ